MEPRSDKDESDTRLPLPRYPPPAGAADSRTPPSNQNTYATGATIATTVASAASGSYAAGPLASPVFTQPRIAACAMAIAEAGAQAAATGGHWCAEIAAQRAVAALRAGFPGENGESALVLVRIFQTCVWDALTAQLRSYVLARIDNEAAAMAAVKAIDVLDATGDNLVPGGLNLADNPQNPDPSVRHPVAPNPVTQRPNLSSTPCLALLATAGDRPAWNDRRASHNHQALPLNGPEVLERVPLALTVLGDLVGAAGAQLNQNGRPRLVVHPVPRAAGSPLVPAQWLIERHSVTAALGLGGLLPTGEAFTVVMFSRAPLPASAAADFAPIAQALHSLLAPVAASPLFEPAGPVGRVLPHEEGQRPAGRPGYNHNQAPVIPPGPSNSSVARFSPAGGARPDRRPEEWAEGRADGWSMKSRPAVEAALRDHRARLAQESRIIETLYSVGQTLAKQLDLGRLVHSAIEAATSVVGARFGAFLYTVREADGLSQTRYALAGLPPDSFDQFPLPRAAALLGSGALISSSIRLADVTEEARHGPGGPYPTESFPARSTPGGSYAPPQAQASATGHPPVRSYLAVPVTAANGEILGSFYFGHPDVGVFTERDEQLAKGVAAHAASAMDNARLYRRERATAMALQHSLLPTTPAQVGDLDVASSYLPGEQGSRVGGDWFDVIALSADRVALVIGDVMGRGIEAAAVMGQLRAAIQAYAVMDLPPAQILDQLNRLVCQLPTDQIATCVYAVFDPGDGTVRWSNAGHLPPLLTTPDGRVNLLEADLGMPLGVDQAVFAEAVRPLPAGSRLLLYTDGLVECRDQSLADRLGELREVLTELSAPGVVVGAQESCKHLINTLLTGAEHDDVAILLITVQPAQTRTARLDLAPTLEAARIARGFIRQTLSDWEADDFTDIVISVASELVNNAAEHAGTPLVLRLRQRDRSIIIEVSDGDGRLVRPTPADLNDERHRGLVIISTLAARWGVRPTETGKTVWAELRST